MEVCEQKYKNFIEFIKKNVKDNTYISILSSCPVEQFLEKLNNEKDKKVSNITIEICHKIDIDINAYPAETIKKFERYISYFIQICKTIY